MTAEETPGLPSPTRRGTPSDTPRVRGGRREAAAAAAPAPGGAAPDTSPGPGRTTAPHRDAPLHGGAHHGAREAAGAMAGTVAGAVEHAVDAVRPVKPRLRGWLHAGMFPASLVAGVVLVYLARTPQARLACAVFSVSAWLLFGVSALYHRGNWGPRARALLRRLDHANIFLIIAGTYTPFTVLLLDGAQRRLLLWLVWTGALVGIGFRVLWIGAPRWLYTPCYAALGWAAVFFLPDFARTGGTTVTLLIVAGGLLYSAGAVVYGLRRPDPSPRWFGFHEVFHSFTLVAFAVHYAGVSIVAWSPVR